MRRSVTSIIVLISLLFSVTEISNVAVLGYSLMTNGDKASGFCTCIGCSHGAESDTQHCSIDMDDEVPENHHEEKTHCEIPLENSGSSVCGCNASPTDQVHIFYNTIDKIALLPTLQFSVADLKRSFFKPFTVQKTDHIHHDIFRPPKA